MQKRYRKMSRKANGKVREIGEDTVVLELPLPMAEVLQGVPEAIEAVSRDVGLMLIGAAMQSECERIAGKKNSKNPEREVYWWGSELGPVYYDKRKVLIERPRLRGVDGKERGLETYKAFRDPKGMKESVIRNMVLGISSRNYEEAVESFSKGYGIKKSSVSRHFVNATAEQVRQFMERDLSEVDLCAIFIDGIEFKEQNLIVALGLDKEGKKHILGLWQGATENKTVCMNLLEELARRGLNMTKNYLFVIDGSKALRSAVAKMFGADVAIQRCQAHKRRNVRDQLPKEHQEAVDARIRAAYKMADYDKAKPRASRG